MVPVHFLGCLGLYGGQPGIRQTEQKYASYRDENQEQEPVSGLAFIKRVKEPCREVDGDIGQHVLQDIAENQADHVGPAEGKKIMYGASENLYMF